MNRPAKEKKSKVTLGNVIKVCSGGRHAWFESSVGAIRKPLIDGSK